MKSEYCKNVIFVVGKEIYVLTKVERAEKRYKPGSEVIMINPTNVERIIMQVPEICSCNYL